MQFGTGYLSCFMVKYNFQAPCCQHLLCHLWHWRAPTALPIWLTAALTLSRFVVLLLPRGTGKGKLGGINGSLILYLSLLFVFLQRGSRQYGLLYMLQHVLRVDLFEQLCGLVFQNALFNSTSRHSCTAVMTTRRAEHKISKLKHQRLNHTLPVHCPLTSNYVRRQHKYKHHEEVLSMLYIYQPLTIT